MLMMQRVPPLSGQSITSSQEPVSTTHLLVVSIPGKCFLPFFLRASGAALYEVDKWHPHLLLLYSQRKSVILKQNTQGMQR